MPAAVSGAELKPTPPDLAVETYKALSKSERNLQAVNARLKTLGYAPVAKSTFFRWMKEKRGIPATLVQQVAPEPVVKVDPIKIDPISLEGVPEDLQEALGLRMLVIAKGRGLDLVEDAISVVATAISRRAEKIADGLLETERETETVTKDGDTVTSKTVEAANAARSAIGALSTLADAMHRIAAARTLFSVGYRNFAEGDRLSGEGDRARAEAEITRQGGSSDRAKVINQDGAASFEDQDAEDEAVQALRDVEGHK